MNSGDYQWINKIDGTGSDFTSSMYYFNNHIYLQSTSTNSSVNLYSQPGTGSNSQPSGQTEINFTNSYTGAFAKGTVISKFTTNGILISNIQTNYSSPSFKIDKDENMYLLFTTTNDNFQINITTPTHTIELQMVENKLYQYTLVKLDKDYQLVWCRKYTSDTDYPISLSFCLYENHIYNICNYKNTLEIYNDANQLLKTIQGSTNTYQFCLINYDKNGNLIWTTNTLPVENNTNINSVTVNASKNGVYVYGYLNNTVESNFNVKFFNQDDIEFKNVSFINNLTNSYWMFLCKYTHQGEADWILSIDNLFPVTNIILFSEGLCIDPWGNIYFTTTSNNGKIYSSNTGLILTLSSNRFLIKIIAFGEIKWLSYISGGFIYFQNIDCDYSGIYVSLKRENLSSTPGDTNFYNSDNTLFKSVSNSLYSITNNYKVMTFYVKYDFNGFIKWINFSVYNISNLSLRGVYIEYTNSTSRIINNNSDIISDKKGSLYITGNYIAECKFIDNNTNEIISITKTLENGDKDLYIGKLFNYEPNSIPEINCVQFNDLKISLNRILN